VDTRQVQAEIDRRRLSDDQGRPFCRPSRISTRAEANRTGCDGHGSPEAITTDGLRSYKAAMDELGNTGKQEIGRWANNRVENSHLQFRRRERAMLRFRQMKSLQKFASVHANVHNHFNLERHLIDRQTYKTRRSAALAEWQSLMA